MNLFHLNSGIDSNVLKSANYDINHYIDFIIKSIDYLKRETLSIKVTKELVNGETRYYPEVPTIKKSERAIEILFNENTKSIYSQNKSFQPQDSIHIINQNEDENYIELESDIQSETIYLQPDTYQLDQQRKALENLRNRPLREHQPLLNLFGFPDSRVWSQNFVTKNFHWQILTDENKDGVNEQREFVSKAIQTNDFALMEGPPGSGKTTAIIELIMQLAMEGKRVLLCSATHAAIDNVIERIKGRYKAVCDKEIVPVRISRYDKPVKENVRPYLLKNICSEYRREMHKNLSSKVALSESQKHFKDNIRFDNINIRPGSSIVYENDIIDQIILESANLVAGTMIGILQHPDIKANKQGASFDVLIVDEASKVTFSDFIVPALHARKWILVGDVKQLSPYVENDYVSEYISQLIDDEAKKSIINQFDLKTKLDDSRFDDSLKVFFTDNCPEKEKQLFGNDHYIVEVVDAGWEASDRNIAAINAADIVCVKNDGRLKQLLAGNIQVKSIFINGETSSLQQRYRQNYLRKSYKSSIPYLFDSRLEDWSEMVSSRLNQSFSFRNAEGFENIERELNYLMPDTIKDSIKLIKRLLFPSILELLQNGIGKDAEQRNNRVISDGFNPFYKKTRFVSLTYQHRMHPDIAKTSRENFYDNNLQPANTVLEDRWWGYANDEPIVKWISNNYNCTLPFERNRQELEMWFSIHNNKSSQYYKRDLRKFINWANGKIFNPREIDDIETELLKFLRWTRNNPKSNGERYEVAILTFYLNQEAELRKRIRRITSQGAFSKFHKDNTDIYLYTVDKFQGQEADLVLLGFTKFTRDAHFNSPNRLNVALTRARHKLILFGNKPWFRERAKLKALRDLATNFESIIRLK